MSDKEDIIAIPEPTTPRLKRQNAFHEKIKIIDSDDDSSIHYAQRIKTKKINISPKRKS